MLTSGFETLVFFFKQKINMLKEVLVIFILEQVFLIYSKKSVSYI
jgi:hypothetical protein